MLLFAIVIEKKIIKLFVSFQKKDYLVRLANGLKGTWEQSQAPIPNPLSTSTNQNKPLKPMGCQLSRKVSDTASEALAFLEARNEFWKQVGMSSTTAPTTYTARLDFDNIPR